MPSPTELAAIVEGEKLTKRDRETILFALSLASYYEDSVIDAHSLEDYRTKQVRPIKGYARVVARCRRNIRRFARLSAKLQKSKP